MVVVNLVWLIYSNKDLNFVFVMILLTQVHGLLLVVVFSDASSVLCDFWLFTWVKTKLNPTHFTCFNTVPSVLKLLPFLVLSCLVRYVIDAMREVCGTDAIYRNAPTTSM